MVIIHRMVLCLDAGLLEYLPHALPLLIAHMASSDVDNEAQRDSEAMVQLVNHDKAHSKECRYTNLRRTAFFS